MLKEFMPLCEKISEYSENLSLENISDAIKEATEEMSLLDIAGDVSGALKILKKGAELFKQVKLNYFYNGLTENDIDGLKKLYAYIDDNQKAEFVSNVFDKVINSNSKFACYLMGVYLTNMTKGRERFVTQEDMVVIIALSVLNDFDIVNFKDIMENCLSCTKQTIDVRKIYEVAKKNGKESAYFYFTLQSCVNTQIISKEGVVDASFDEDDVSLSSVDYGEAYCINSITQKFYQLVTHINIINNNV